MTLRIAALALCASLVAGPVTAQSSGVSEEEILAEMIQAYTDFSTYDQGIIFPEQIDKSVFDSVLFVDTRNEEQAAANEIPGAIQIDWREVPHRLDELPETGLVILYCNTGTLSAQAMVMARLMGRENVLALQTGIEGWLQNAAYKP